MRKKGNLLIVEKPYGKLIYSILYIVYQQNVKHDYCSPGNSVIKFVYLNVAKGRDICRIEIKNSIFQSHQPNSNAQKLQAAIGYHSALHRRLFPSPRGALCCSEDRHRAELMLVEYAQLPQDLMLQTVLQWSFPLAHCSGSS